MNSGATRRLALIIALAAIFGAVMAWVKGNNGDWHDAVGNLSAPWLLLPFLAGALAGARRVVIAAVVGLAATAAALAGFYFANSFVLDLGPHPWLVDLSLTMRGGLYYLERACVTGPVFGAIGFWWHQRRSLLATAVIAGAFVLEPVAWWLYGLRIGGGAAYPVPAYPALWLSEVLLGVIGFALVFRARRQAGDG